MVGMFDYDGTEAFLEAADLASRLTDARHEVEARGIKAFLFNSSSPEEFNERAAVREVSAALEEIADSYLGSRAAHTKIASALKREFVAANCKCKDGEECVCEGGKCKCVKNASNKSGGSIEVEAAKETVHLDSGDVKIEKGKLTREVGGKPSEHMDKVRELAEDGHKDAQFFLNVLHHGGKADKYQFSEPPTQAAAKEHYIRNHSAGADEEGYSPRQEGYRSWRHMHGADHEERPELLDHEHNGVYLDWPHEMDLPPDRDRDKKSSIRMGGKWTICPSCEGDGSYVNPSIDSQGLSSEDFDEDPDFRENYFSGAYDVPCTECRGSGKVPGCSTPGCDNPALSYPQDSGFGMGEHRNRHSADHYPQCFNHLDPNDREGYDSHQESLAEQAAERRMGA